MVVLKPLLPGERMKTCKCGHLGLASPVAERSSFYPRTARARAGEFHAICRWCNVKAVAAREKTDAAREKRRLRYARRQARLTEDQRAEQRRKGREKQRRARERDPEGARARSARANEAYRERQKALVGAKALREIRRIDDVDRRVRRGTGKLALVKDVRSTSQTAGERLPIAPFSRWLYALVAHQRVLNGMDVNASERGRVADSLEISVRNLHAWMDGHETIDYCVVDRAASHHGGTTVEEIYRDYGNGTYFKTRPDGKFLFVVHQWVPEAGAAVEGAKKRVAAPCRSPKCEEDRAEGSRFCPEHVALFAKLRGDLADETQAFRSTIKRKGMRSTCCRPGCTEPRLATERYCDACDEAGWREEAIE